MITLMLILWAGPIPPSIFSDFHRNEHRYILWNEHYGPVANGDIWWVEAT